MPAIDPDIQMWAVFAIIAGALVLYASERLAIELTSLGVVGALLVFFHLFPVADAAGANALGAERLLSGFANPALLTVVALLVMGQGLVGTGVLDQVAGAMFALGGGVTRILVLALAFVVVVSAFLNNIPVVVIFIPIMHALAARFNRPASQMMMPLSYVAILGGMTTLIGSSTNLLVSGGLVATGHAPFGFFDFTVPGLVMAGVGFVYVTLAMPRLLPDRASPASRLGAGSGRQFIAQFTASAGSKLVGQRATGGLFASLPEVTVRLVQRGEHAFLPPFEDLTIAEGDVLVVAATRTALTDAIRRDPGLLDLEMGEGRREGSRRGDSRRTAGQVLAEVMVTPASRIIGQNLERIKFRQRYNVVVLGIQRRSRMVRGRLTEIRLEAGDVLLIQGRLADVEALRGSPHVLPMEWSATDVPSPFLARYAVSIFLIVVGLAASGLVPVVIAAFAGAVAMIGCGCLDLRQAARAVDRNIVLMIGAALAMGASMQETGGGEYIAEAIVAGFGDSGPAVVLSAFFLVVALLANVISTKACAVLFTPIAVSIAGELGADPIPFAVAVVFGANCSFASPIGYQTNLLVMGPGNYRFKDFARAGLPLIVVLWIAFTLLAPAYYGI